MRNNNLLSVLSIITSIIALSLVFVHPKGLEANMFNIIVTILTLLVTILIGWQIFQIINVDKIRSEIKEEKKAVRLEKESMKAELYFEMSQHFIDTNTNKRWYYILKSINAATNCDTDKHLVEIEKHLKESPFALSGMDRTTFNKMNSALFGFDLKKLYEHGNFQEIESVISL